MESTSSPVLLFVPTLCPVSWKERKEGTSTDSISDKQDRNVVCQGHASLFLFPTAQGAWS